MFLISPDLLQAVHDYLTTRPMFEVEKLVTSLRQCSKAEKPVTEKPTDETAAADTQ